MLIMQLSEFDIRWVTYHYLCGLDREVSAGLVSSLSGGETLDELVKRACNVARNLEFGKSLDFAPSSQLSRLSNSVATSAVASRPSIRKVKSSPKLTESEQEYLSKNRGCWFCRKINVDHIVSSCPEKKMPSLAATKGELKEVKKEFINALVIVESESDSEYLSCPKSVPTIKLAAKIGDATLPVLLVNCGAIINLLSSDKVVEHSIPTLPMPPMWIHEPMNPNGTLVNQKVVNKVKLPEDDWESCLLTEFVVTPLKDHDTILGMPFLAAEEILVDPAQQKVILPS